jgi:hypothetical protein
MSQHLAVVDAQSVDGVPTVDLTFIPPFVYGLPWSLDVPWSDGAVFRIVSDDGSETHELHKSDGEAVGDFTVFTFNKGRSDVHYRGSIVDGDAEFQLFGAVALRRVQDPGDPVNHLPLPDPPKSDDGGGADAEPSPDPTTASGGNNDP